MCKDCGCEEDVPDLFKTLKDEAHLDKKIQNHQVKEAKKKIDKEVAEYNQESYNETKQTKNQGEKHA